MYACSCSSSVCHQVLGGRVGVLGQGGDSLACFRWFLWFFSALSLEDRLSWGVSSSPAQPWSWEMEVLNRGRCGEE